MNLPIKQKLNLEKFLCLGQVPCMWFSFISTSLRLANCFLSPGLFLNHNLRYWKFTKGLNSYPLLQIPSTPSLKPSTHTHTHTPTHTHTHNHTHTLSHSFDSTEDTTVGQKECVCVGVCNADVLTMSPAPSLTDMTALLPCFIYTHLYFHVLCDLLWCVSL